LSGMALLSRPGLLFKMRLLHPDAVLRFIGIQNCR
jgi:hypothetical protein